MKKTYVIPSMTECVVVQRAMHSEFKDAACRYPLPRIAHHFLPNERGVAQFETEDPEVQKFLENRPTFKDGTMIILPDGKVSPANPDAVNKVQQGVVQTPAQKEEPAAPAKPAAPKKAGAKTALK